MTALRFQTGGRHRTSPASLQGPRTIREWNNFPASVVEASTIDTFVSRTSRLTFNCQGFFLGGSVQQQISISSRLQQQKQVGFCLFVCFSPSLFLTLGTALRRVRAGQFQYKRWRVNVGSLPASPSQLGFIIRVHLCPFCRRQNSCRMPDPPNSGRKSDIDCDHLTEEEDGQTSIPTQTLGSRQPTTQEYS